MPRYYHEQPIPEAQETKRKVTEVEFLIHPAFHMLTNIYANIKEGHLPDDYLKALDRMAHSLDLTIERAKTNYEGKDKLMVAFLLGRPKHIKDQRRLESFRTYNQRIEQLRSILKEKLIVISDGDSRQSTSQMGNRFKHILHNLIRGTKNKIKRPDESPNKSVATENPKYMAELVEGIRRIAAARGFELDSQAASKAFGEEALECVRNGAANLNKHLNLRSKTTVLPALTEVSRAPQHLKYEYDDTIQGFRDNVGSQSDSKYVRFKKLDEAE